MPPTDCLLCLQRFVRTSGVPIESAVRVYRRYLKLEPEHVEEFIAFLKGHEMWGEAARRLAEVCVSGEGGLAAGMRVASASS